MNKYILQFNDEQYFVEFREVDENRKYGARGHTLESFTNYPPDLIVSSDEKNNAYVIEGNVNLHSYIEKIIKGNYMEYKEIKIIRV